MSVFGFCSQFEFDLVGTAQLKVKHLRLVAGNTVSSRSYSALVYFLLNSPDLSKFGLTFTSNFYFAQIKVSR